MAFLADAPLGAAISTALPPGKILTTSDLTMSFLRPASVESERLVARSRIIHVGRSLGLAETAVEDARGRLLAHGTTRAFLVEVVSPPPDPPEEMQPWVPPEYEPPTHISAPPWERCCRRRSGTGCRGWRSSTA
jgi:hypothetical protein